MHSKPGREYFVNSMAVKFQKTAQDVHFNRPAQTLKDLKAFVVETDSITRTIESIEPLEELITSAAA